MTTRLLPNEVLTFGNSPSGCLQCGKITHFVWLEIHPFCSLECLEEYAKEWNAEMNGEADEQRFENAPPVPEWWPWYFVD